MGCSDLEWAYSARARRSAVKSCGAGAWLRGRLVLALVSLNEAATLPAASKAARRSTTQAKKRRLHRIDFGQGRLPEDCTAQARRVTVVGIKHQG